MSDESLFTDADLGVEPGKRVERVEWGLRQTIGTYLMKKGQVELRSNEESARSVVGNIYYGWRGTEVVRRTVVTYTTEWEAAP